jgi:hypothetical protein
MSILAGQVSHIRPKKRKKKQNDSQRMKRWRESEMWIESMAGGRMAQGSQDGLSVGSYENLRSAISICLLDKKLFRDDAIAHHHFRLVDTEHGLEIPDSIEIHTVELTKYNLEEATISSAPEIEQWAFFFLYADRYEPERLRELLPGIEFQRAISVVEAIAEKTEDRMMYDQRLKAQLDYQWGLNSAREQGAVIGKIQILQELLGEASSSTTSLQERTIGELSTMLADLQHRLRSRDS